MKFKFKLIPFLLSLLIVVGVTFGICWYSYHDYPLNKFSFYEEYFHLEDYAEYETTELIENAVKFQYEGYKKASSTVSVINNEENGVTYKDGTINVPNYFDIDIYITVVDNEGEKTYSYYFYFYNVNYQNSTLVPNEDIAIILVNGIGEGTDVEEDEDKYGNALLDEAIENLGDEDTTNNPSYNSLAAFGYTGIAESVDTSRIYPIYDNGFTGDPDVEEGSEHYVWRCAPRLDYSHAEIYNEDTLEDGEATFAIIKLDDTNEELCRGTITGVDKISETSFDAGYSSIPTNSYYSSVVLPRVLLHGGIAFVISAVIAFLFYLLWLDPKEQVKTTNTKNNKKKNKR